MKHLTFIWLFFTSSLLAAPCGLEGTIEERIKSCNFSKENFVLIVRSESGLEIYQDQKTKLFWGDRITTDFNHYSSNKACSNDLAEAKLLKEVKWRLPSVREFETAAAHGMKDSLPHMTHAFWTATAVKRRRGRRRRSVPAQAYLWEGEESRTDTGDLKDAASVRCVGRK